MDERNEDQRIELREYVELLRRQKWMIALSALLTFASALAFSYRQTPLYKSQTRVFLEAIPTDPSVPAAPPSLTTESQLVQSTPVAARVKGDLGLAGPPEELLSNVEVIAVPESAVLEIVYTSSDPEVAAAGADSFARSYLAYRRATARQKLLAAKAELRERIELTEQELKDLAVRIEDARVADNEDIAQILESEEAAVLGRLTALQQRLNDVQPELAAQLGRGEVIETAEPADSPASPNHRLNGTVGGIVGIMLGIALALFRQRLDNRFAAREDVERSLRTPVLMTVPRFKVAASRARPLTALPILSDPIGAASEAYRSLRTNVQFIAAQKGVKSILVTSAVAGEGKTITTANLAVSMVQAGLRVIVLSCDLRKPTIEMHFGIPNHRGLSEWLVADGIPAASYIRDPGIANLRIFPSGPIPSNPAEILTASKLVDLITDLEEVSDFVLLDSPPVLSVADASILASRVGGTILVLDARHTERTAAVHARTELERLGAKILGTVLNGLDPKRSPYRSYAAYHHPYRAYAAASQVSSTSRFPGNRRRRFRRAEAEQGT